jgi:hypothetical protein
VGFKTITAKQLHIWWRSGRLTLARSTQAKIK